MSRSELSRELVYAFQYVDDRYLDVAEQEAAFRARRFFWKSVSPVAACIIGLILILVLPIVAIAANWFGLKDLLLHEKSDIPPLGYGTSQEGERQERELIGLSGFQESAEAQALNEWRLFLDEYDPDGEIIGVIGNALTGFEEKYGLYTVYTQEMADKLEEIAQKYQLKLHTEMRVVAPDELEAYVGGKFLGRGIDISMGYPYLYENGTFHLEGDAFYGESGQIGFQCRRTVKGTLDEVTLRIGNIDEYQESRYTAACGETVILALSAGKSLIFADFDQCFVLWNILGGSESGITEEVLKEIADKIDFTVLKEVRRLEDSAVDGNGAALQPEGNAGSGQLGGENAGAWQPEGIQQGSGQPGGGQPEGVLPGGAAGGPEEDALAAMRERYRAILLENAEFVQIVHTEHRERDKKLRLENIREAVTDEEDVTVEATQFAVVDLDGNGYDEIVLWLRVNGTLDYGVEILYDCGGEVYGFTLAYRQCMNLKTDGFFEASASASDTSICRLHLSEEGYAIEEALGIGSGTFDKKTDVEWHDLTEGNVECEIPVGE